MVWHGWMHGAPVPAENPSDGTGALLGALAEPGPGESIPVITCDDPSALWVTRAGRSVLIGRVDAGVRMNTHEETRSGQEVTIDGGWVRAGEGWHFEIRPNAGCERSTYDKPPAAGIGELLGEALEGVEIE